MASRETEAASIDPHQGAHSADAAPSASPARAASVDRIHLHMPVDVRSASLAVIAVLASLFAMQWAKDVLVPLLMGVLLSYALSPLVGWLCRCRVPRSLAAGVVVTLLVGLLGTGVWVLSGQADALASSLPDVAQKVRQLAERHAGGSATLKRVQEAAAEVQKAADNSAAAPPAASPRAASAVASGAVAPPDAAPRPAPAPARVIIEKPRLDLRDYVLAGTSGVLTLLGQVAVIFVVALFLLASGDSFRRKMARLAGPRLGQKRITIEAIKEIAAQIERYLLCQLAVSVVVGAATWLAFLAFGLNQAAVWGVVAAVTNLVPYLGAVLVGAGSAAVGLMQFDSVRHGLLIGASSFAIHAVVGNLLTPWVMGRASRMNPFAVFVSVLLFGWLWGVWGLLLGVPVLLVVRAVCERVEELVPVGELLSA